mgnify:CR=1 FL=1
MIERADTVRVGPMVGSNTKTKLAAVEGLAVDDDRAEAVGVVALVAGQDVVKGDRDGTWRIATVTRPDRMVSVHDPESRHVHKTNHNYRDGFKAHIAAEPDTGLVTACELTAGNVGDAQAAPRLLAGEPAGREILGDSAYGSAAFRAQLIAARHPPRARGAGGCRLQIPSRPAGSHSRHHVAAARRG